MVNSNNNHNNNHNSNHNHNTCFSIQGVGICQPPATANVAIIEFHEDFGPQPPFVPRLDPVLQQSGGSVQIGTKGQSFVDMNFEVYSSQTGTKDNSPCAGRGLCDPDGLCQCYSSNGDVYASSNGYGAPGDRGDCGYVSQLS